MADQKLSALTSGTAEGTDIIYAVKNPGPSEVDRKIALSSVKDYVMTTANTWDAAGFQKANPDAVAFEKTGAGTARTAMAMTINVNGTILSIPAATAITMPGSLTGGTDYAIWVKTDGSLEATTDHVSPPATGARKIGGFHYAPGGNAPIYSKAAVAAGTALPAGTIPADQWGVYKVEIDSTGTITVTAGAANYTTGYATEAAANTAMPANASGRAEMGWFTVKTAAGQTFVAGTDALQGGTGGNPASTTTYNSRLAVLSRGTTATQVQSSAFVYGLGGDTTPAINEYSFWDLKWRPACPDPRGMTLVSNAFWCDIYMLGVDHHTNGTSKNNVAIADGSAPPKVPTAYGGDGSLVYRDGNWWNLAEVLESHGKRPLTYDEYAAAAWGVAEARSRGNDPATTGLGTTNNGSSHADAVFTSKWGVIQASGCLWVWGADFGASTGGAGDTTQGRGTVSTGSRVVLLGGDWNFGAASGSRCSDWGGAPTLSVNAVSVRARCDHLRLV